MRQVEETIRTRYAPYTGRVIFFSIYVLSLAIAGRAEAQERVSPGVQSEPTPADQIITTLPNESVGSQGYPRPVQGYQQYELEEANRGIRNIRNALIATSALAGVGMIVGATAFGHCEFIYYNVNRPDDLVCTQRGDALFVAGGTIFGLAAIGMITSGIMLGVRKGKRRRLRRDMRSQRGAYPHWNVESARLEF